REVVEIARGASPRGHVRDEAGRIVVWVEGHEDPPPGFVGLADLSDQEVELLLPLFLEPRAADRVKRGQRGLVARQLATHLDDPAARPPPPPDLLTHLP